MAKDSFTEEEMNRLRELLVCQAVGKTPEELRNMKATLSAEFHMSKGLKMKYEGNFPSGMIMLEGIMARMLLAEKFDTEDVDDVLSHFAEGIKEKMEFMKRRERE